MTSLRDTRSAGVPIASPLTITRPSAINFSASRREQTPARAIALAMRSPDGESITTLAFTFWRRRTVWRSKVQAGMQDDELMAAALEQAEHAAKRGEVPVGAVLAAEGRILAGDGNRVVE